MNLPLHRFDWSSEHEVSWSWLANAVFSFDLTPMSRSRIRPEAPGAVESYFTQHNIRPLLALRDRLLSWRCVPDATTPSGGELHPKGVDCRFSAPAAPSGG